MSGPIPAPYKVAHISRQTNKSGTKDAHGNYPRVTPDPVIRTANSFVQPRRGSLAKFDTETNTRERNEIHMSVPDPQHYRSGDQVLAFGSVDDNGNYVGGQAFWVDGDPDDDRLAPWTRAFRFFGGIVKLRRVT